MKRTTFLFLVSAVTLLGFQPATQESNIEFKCMKTHKATNTCHFNFTVDGAKYRYLDKGCKYSRKTDELIKKVKEGSVALAKDWKIECSPAK